MDEFSTSYHSTRPTSSPWAWAAAGLGLAVFGMQVAIYRQESAATAAVASLQLQLMAAAQRSNVVAEPAEPARFLIDGLTPSADQMLRGDCWLFATTGILEDSYRRYGVERGWFPPDQYLRLSRQALGIAILEECKKSPNSFCPSDNLAGNVLSWGNTTEGQDGADERLMAYLKDVGKGGAVPDSVCGYSPVPGWIVERECPGLSTLKATNPLEFRVKSLRTHFARDDIKAALRRGGKPLSLGLGEISTPFYPPCDKRAGCDPETAQCVACPLERAYAGVSCCVLVSRPMVSMKGEWFHQPGEPLSPDGGHSINIVGYSDTYRTEWGAVGGYIVRNTWKDGLGAAHGLRARGSHTAAFYYQTIGDLDEALLCPNPNSPRSWTPCMTHERCSSSVTRMEAISTHKVLELTCIDIGLPAGSLPKGACEAGDGYYLANMTEYGSSGLFTACFLRFATPTSATTDTCYPPLTLDDLALVFGPTAAELKRLGTNDPAACGYNFISYATYEALQAKFGGVTATSYDIEWSEASYASRADKPSVPKHLDYSLVEANTHPLVLPTAYMPTKFSA